MKTKLFILAILASFSSILISCEGEDDESESPKKIEVTGSAEMEVIPNEIYMTFTLKEYLDAAKQKVKLENIKADFLKQCKTAGVADSNISIFGYSGNERWDYWWRRKSKKEPDFMGSISYSIKASSADLLDKIVAALNENAVESFAITKTTRNDMEQLRKEVKKKALIATKDKAQYLAQSIGQEIGEALLIQEVEGNYYGTYSNVMSNESLGKRKQEDENSSGPSFQKIKLRYEMRAEFELK